MQKRTRNLLISVAVLLIAAFSLFAIPALHTKIVNRWGAIDTTLYYLIHPPQNIDFVPTQQELLTQTLDQSTATPTVTTTPAPTLAATPVPTETPTPLPSSVILPNIKYVSQNDMWNYCGPANLTMALKYWGWTGTKYQVGAVIKPGINNPALSQNDQTASDVNVMPYEMVDFVNNDTSFKALWRVGGNLDLVKQLIAAGFPVIVEKAIYQILPPEDTMQWAGHYAFTTGYDDTTQEFTWQDSYTTPQYPVGVNQKVSYSDYLNEWRAFDYVFIVVYPPERENDLFQVLGNYTDDTWADQTALNTAQQEAPTLSGIDQLYAWFNKGTSYGYLGDYNDAAAAYDAFFLMYDDMPANQRPYRIFLWYQTGALRAYYYTDRYQDVITLADQENASLKPPRYLEESYYYRGLAEAALGEYPQAYADVQWAVYLNRNFQLALSTLGQWAVPTLVPGPQTAP
jgi:tetratricopeptide (TPR) repeat protein